MDNGEVPKILFCKVVYAHNIPNKALCYPLGLFLIRF